MERKGKGLSKEVSIGSKTTEKATSVVFLGTGRRLTNYLSIKKETGRIQRLLQVEHN